jgi:signal transduction histidine kinase
VKFTPPGGQIIISVHTHGDHVRIQVTDTGIGISPELLPYIFDAFRQAEVPEAPMVRPGLGLGLAIVRHLVELHNGFIEAASPGAGRGAVFTLNLPLQARKAAHAGS